MTYKPLKVRVEDEEDLNIISACLQDSLIPLTGIEYDPKSQTFYLIANRFCWECDPEHVEGIDYHNRVAAGVTFHHVKKVQQKGIDPTHQAEIVNLLTIHNPEQGCVHLVFSGGPEIKLEVDKLCCHLADIDEPYPTSQKPTHR